MDKTKLENRVRVDPRKPAALAFLLQGSLRLAAKPEEPVRWDFARRFCFSSRLLCQLML